MTDHPFERWIGPRISREDMARGRAQYLLPTLLLGAAGLLLLVSVFLPYWRIGLRVPQYSSDLEVRVYLGHLEGDVQELEMLRHLAPVEPLPGPGRLEPSLAVAVVVVVALLAAAAVYIHNRWAALLTLPGVLFPAVFYGDVASWLGRLEGAAAAAGPGLAVDPSPGPGWVAAVAAAASILLGLAFHRRAYRPLVRAAK